MINAIQNAKEAQVKMESRKKAFLFWMTNGVSSEDYDLDDSEVIQEFENLGDFHEYGLSFSFMPASEYFDGHFCYLLSTGGPSEEIRFFPDGKIEFVYKPWFDCQVIDVTKDPVYHWVREYFNELNMLDFEAHYDELYYSDSEEIE